VPTGRKTRSKGLRKGKIRPYQTVLGSFPLTELRQKKGGNRPTGPLKKLRSKGKPEVVEKLADKRFKGRTRLQVTNSKGNDREKPETFHRRETGSKRMQGKKREILDQSVDLGTGDARMNTRPQQNRKRQRGGGVYIQKKGQKYMLNQARALRGAKLQIHEEGGDQHQHPTTNGGRKKKRGN